MGAQISSKRRAGWRPSHVVVRVFDLGAVKVRKNMTRWLSKQYFAALDLVNLNHIVVEEVQYPGRMSPTHLQNRTDPAINR